MPPESCLIFLLHHGWLNLLKVHLVGICLVMLLRQIVLKVVQRLFMGVSSAKLSRKFATSWSRSSTSFAVLALFHKWMRLLTALCLDGSVCVDHVNFMITKARAWYALTQQNGTICDEEIQGVDSSGRKVYHLFPSNAKYRVNEDRVDMCRVVGQIGIASDPYY